MTPESYGAGLIAGRGCDSRVAALLFDEVTCGDSHAPRLPSVIFKSKRKITRGKLSLGNLRGMDTSWTEQREPWERLKWARTQAGFATATSAAESLGMKKDTYTAYERAVGSSKHTDIDHQRAIQFGRKFKVSWTWLLAAEGTPFDKPSSPAQERVLSAMANANPDEQDRVAEAVELLLKRSA
nr:MAG TPA: hypothetical protein [Caudoviricetes sp.]